MDGQQGNTGNSRLGEKCGLGNECEGIWNSEELFVAGEPCLLKRFLEWLIRNVNRRGRK